MGGSEALWAEHGLTGLVLFALFAILGVGVQYLHKKDKIFIQELHANREERKEARDQNHETQHRLATALDGLTKEISRKRESNDGFIDSEQREPDGGGNGHARRRDPDRLEQAEV